MQTLVRIVLGMSIAGAFGGWFLDIVPGRLESFLILLFFLSFATIYGSIIIGLVGSPVWLFAIWANYYDIRDWVSKLRTSRNRSSFDKGTFVEALAIPCFGILFLVVSLANIPESIGFWLSRSTFETASEGYASNHAAMPKDGRSVIAVGKRFGIYRVDQVGIDGRGGIYFRVNTSQDGPDRMSYGFVKNPNRTGSPFGRASYAVSHIAGDWYVFKASDDFY
ncbi:hypothetical protein GC170_16435 [bacterium]|nr:hypothetical protein [bacterium]